MLRETQLATFQADNLSPTKVKSKWEIKSEGAELSLDAGFSHGLSYSIKQEKFQGRQISCRVSEQYLQLVETSFYESVYASISLEFESSILPTTVEFCEFVSPSLGVPSLYLFLVTQNRVLYRFEITHPVQKGAPESERARPFLEGLVEANRQQVSVQLRKAKEPQILRSVTHCSVVVSTSEGKVVGVDVPDRDGERSAEFDFQDDEPAYKKYFSGLLARGAPSRPQVLSLSKIEVSEQDALLATLCEDKRVELWSVASRTTVAKANIEEALIGLLGVAQEQANIQVHFLQSLSPKLDNSEFRVLVVASDEGSGRADSRTQYYALVFRGRWQQASEAAPATVSHFDVLESFPLPPEVTGVYHDALVWNGSLFVLTSTAQSQCAVFHTPFVRRDGPVVWEAVRTRDDDVADILPPHERLLSQRAQAYVLGRIAEPGLFSSRLLRTCVKRYSGDDLMHMSIAEAVRTVVDNDITTQTSGAVLDPDELLEVQTACWRSFVERATRLWIAECAPHALCTFAVPANAPSDMNSCVGVVRKSGVSVLRLASPVEQRFIIASKNTHLLSQANEDLALPLVDSCYKLTRELGMSTLLQAHEYLFSASGSLPSEVLDRVNDFVPFPSEEACNALFADLVQSVRKDLLAGVPSSPLFPLYVSPVCECLRQDTSTRLSVARALLLLLSTQMDERALAQLRVVYKSLFLMDWFAAIRADAPLDLSSEGLESLSLSHGLVRPPMPTDLLSLFVQQHRTTIDRLTPPTCGPFAALIPSLASIVREFCLGPLDKDKERENIVGLIRLANHLVALGMWSELEEITDLVSEDLQLMSHFKGLCLSQRNEHEPAYEAFSDAVVANANAWQAAFVEDLFKHAPSNLKDMTTSGSLAEATFANLGYSPQMAYLCRLINYLNNKGAHDQVLDALDAAIELTLSGPYKAKDKELQSTLYGVQFLNNLDLRRYDDAFKALINLPLQEHGQETKLTRLLDKMYEASRDQEHKGGLLDKMVTFPYLSVSASLEDAARDYMYRRANEGQPASRSKDGIVWFNRWHEVLFAFHMHRSCFMPAAQIMFELGTKLSKLTEQAAAMLSDHDYRDYLDKQTRAFSAALTTLSLVESPKERFLVVPVLPPEMTQFEGSYQPEESSSKKRPLGSPAAPQLAEAISSRTKPRLPSSVPRRGQTVVTVECIRQAYLLSKARLALPFIAPIDPAQVLIHLANHGMFDAAASLLSAYSPQPSSLSHEAGSEQSPTLPRIALRDARHLFVQLTAQCVLAELTKKPEDEPASPPTTRRVTVENNSFMDLHEEQGSVRYVPKYTQSEASLWGLLKRYLEAFDSAQTNYCFHTAVLETILPHGAKIIPNWLRVSMKKKNPTSLVLTLLKFNMVEDACETTTSFLKFLKQGEAMAEEQEFSKQSPISLTIIQQVQDTAKHVEKSNVGLQQAWRNLVNELQ